MDAVSFPAGNRLHPQALFSSLDKYSTRLWSLIVSLPLSDCYVVHHGRKVSNSGWRTEVGMSSQSGCRDATANRVRQK
jgi:hypothetical protein